VTAKNILFIMFDQLRWDYLSCYGRGIVDTPHIDRLAQRGVRFDRAYIQSPICGASRMSTYTGRYVQSHGASWNNVPLKVGEQTLGDHLRRAGMGCHLVGKTHMLADAEGMARLGLAPDSVIGARLSECGFDVFERDDGLRAEGPGGLYDPKGALKYNAYLRDKGYASENPWHDYANSAVDAEGNVQSGWFLQNSDKRANIAEEDSETPYLTRRGMEFIEQADGPWLCHLSYIKPHWPYIVPEPYASMYGPDDVPDAVRSQAEYDQAHPVLRGFMDNPIGKAFSRDEVRDKVIPAYMGLIKQCDDQMGVLFNWLEETGRMQDTMIVITSDHGDFLGDHWMGEKTFFQDASTRVPIGVEVQDAWMFMVATKDWKLIHFPALRPMLFDLKNDPDELVDLGQSADHADVLEQMYAHLRSWSTRVSQRTTRSHEGLIAMRGKSQDKGILLGVYGPEETHPEAVQHYVGRKAKVIDPAPE